MYMRRCNDNRFQSPFAGRAQNHRGAFSRPRRGKLLGSAWSSWLSTILILIRQMKSLLPSSSDGASALSQRCFLRERAPKVGSKACGLADKIIF